MGKTTICFKITQFVDVSKYLPELCNIFPILLYFNIFYISKKKISGAINEIRVGVSKSFFSNTLGWSPQNFNCQEFREYFFQTFFVIKGVLQKVFLNIFHKLQQNNFTYFSVFSVLFQQSASFFVTLNC